MTCKPCGGTHILVINFQAKWVPSLRSTMSTNLFYRCPRITDKVVNVPVIITFTNPQHSAMEAQVVEIIDTTANSPAPPSVGPEAETLIEFGKNVLLNSISTLKDFIGFMVPLTTALITAYIAILQFMGIEVITDATMLLKSNLIIPPILMLISLIAFIIASYPIPRKIAVGNLDSIENYRSNTFWWKYIWSAMGGIFFISGVLGMILVIIPIINGPDSLNEQLTTYINPKFGYEFQYPPYWQLHVFNHSKIVIITLSEPSSGPQFKVEIDEFDSPPRIDQYVRERINILRGGLTSFSIIDDRPAYTIKWNSTSNSGAEILTIKDKRGYLLNFQADNTDYIIYNPTVQNIIQSFKFVD